MNGSARALDVLACPSCGNGLASPAGVGEGACVSCRNPYRMENSILSWGNPLDKISDPSRKLSSLVLRQFNPLGSRLSPLRHITDFRINQYYRRSLSDRSLAEAWGRHNLQGLNLQPGAMVLDHGCGRGRHSAFLSNLGFQVAAQDIQVNFWWRKLRQCVFQSVPASAPRLPWKDGTFALVYDFAVIHYMSEQQLSAFVAEVFRVLAPGGYWLLAEPNDESYGAPTMRRAIGRLHSLAHTRETVAQCGFQEVDLSYEGFFAPAFPLYVDFLRKILNPSPLDVSDFESTIAARIAPRRRKHWRLRLQKPGSA